MMNRRKFLNGLVHVTGSSFFIPSFLDKTEILLKTTNKKYSAGVFMSPSIGGVFTDFHMQFVNQLNSSFNEVNFFVSTDPETSQLKITSPFLEKQPESMLFLNRAPGGLEKSNFKNWLASSTAKGIWHEAYADKGHTPFYLFLGPAKCHQVISLKFEEKNGSGLIPFGSSSKRSWRSAIEKFQISQFSTLKKVKSKIDAGEIMSLEALQPKIADTFKKQDEVIFMEDGLSSTPALYQLLVNNDFWNSLKLSQKDLLANTIENFSAQLDSYVTSEENKYDSNLLPLDKLQTLPESILRMRYLEKSFSKELLAKYSRRPGMKSLYEAYEAFRTQPLIKHSTMS